MIWLTSFDPVTKEVIGVSTDSGFPDMAAASQMMVTDDNVVSHSRRLLILQGGIALSDYPFKLEQHANE